MRRGVTMFPRVMWAALGLSLCAAVLFVTAVHVGVGAPAARLSDPNVLTLGAAHWNSNRLPADESTHRRSAARHVGQKITNAVRALDFVAGGAKAAQHRWPLPAASSALSSVSGGMASELADADNSAAALRQQSFRWAVDDCEKDSSCESLLGKTLYNVLQTKRGRPNLAIYHDRDDLRKGEERSMEHDYRSAARAGASEGGGESQSEARWQRLSRMMHTQWRARAPTARGVLRQADAIDAEHIPAGEKKILIANLMSKSRIARRAASLNDAYRSETSLIFPSGSRSGGSASSHGEEWNTYQASMLPTTYDTSEEAGIDQQQMARPTEKQELLKYQRRAITSGAKGRQDMSQAVRREVARWTQQAEEQRNKDTASANVVAGHRARQPSENDGDAVAAANMRDSIDAELSRYGSLTSAEHDRDELLHEEDEERAARRRARRRERAFTRHRAMEHSRQIDAEVAEAKEADQELKSYDSAFVPHTPSSLLRPTRSSLDALGLSSSLSDTPGDRGADRGRDLRTQGGGHQGSRARPRTLGERRAAKEKSVVTSAKEIAPSVKVAKESLSSVGSRRVRHAGGHLRGGKCYIAGGKAVACEKLTKLAKLLKNVYGSRASDVAIVAKDHSFDPTLVLPSRPRARQGKKAATHASTNTKRARHAGGVGKRVGESRLGKALHEANVKAAEERGVRETKAAQDEGSLAKLSDNLGNILGW